MVVTSNTFTHSFIKGLIGIALITIIGICTRCSWVEDFMIVNSSEQSVYITYDLDTLHNSFPIFDHSPIAYKLHPNHVVNRNDVTNILDEDTSYFKVKVLLPANCALFLGRLLNDTYKSYNQYFINGRKFNLRALHIKSSNQNIDIFPANFDSFFKKKKGMITYEFK